MTASGYALANAVDAGAFHANAATTTTGQGTGVDLNDFEGVIVLTLDSVAPTGTTPTMANTFEESDDNSTGWTAVPAAAFNEGSDFTALTTAASRQLRHLDVTARKRYMREVHTIGGTTPSYTYSLTAIGKKKYR